MTEVTQGLIFQELQRLQSRLDETQGELSETLTLLRTTNRNLAEGRAKIETQKRIE